MNVRLCTNNQVGKNNKQNDPNNNISFRSGFLATDLMRYVDTEKAIGATAVDVISMCAPRTIIDTARNPTMGFETFFRENSTCFLHLAIGLFGVGAAKLMGGKFKSDYNVDASKIHANEDTIDTCAHFFHDAIKNKKGQGNDAIVTHYLNGVFDSVKGLDGENWKELKSHENTKAEIVKEMKELIHASNNDKYVMPNEKKDLMLSKITQTLGARSNLKIDLGNNKEISTSGELLLKDVYTLGKSFLSDKVKPTFENAEKIADNNFVKDLKHITRGKTAIGLTVAAAIAMSLQKVNNWITKKRTGKEGFVGTGDAECKPDKSAGFIALKTLSAAAMAALVVKSIVMGGKIKDIPRRIQFTGVIPHLEHYKVIYGLNLIGRIFSTRNKDELRETNTRDFMGYANWLIFGGIVTKLVAHKLGGKDLINHEGNSNKINMKWILNASVKSHDEVAEPILKDKMYKNGVKQKYSAVLKTLENTAEHTALKTKIKNLNIAQAAGIVYSTVVLGIGIPIWNKCVTENKNKERNNSIIAQTKRKLNSYTFMQNNKKIKEETRKTFANFAGQQ